MRRRFDVRNTRQDATLKALLRKVERNVVMDARNQPRAAPYGDEVPGLYVHPTSGRLLNAHANHRQHPAPQMASAVKRVDVTETLQLHLLSNVWYWVELAPLRAPRTYAKKAVVSASGDVLIPARQETDRDSVCKDVLLGAEFYVLPPQGELTRRSPARCVR